MGGDNILYKYNLTDNILERALVTVDIHAQLEPIRLDNDDGKWDFTCSDTFFVDKFNQRELSGAKAELAVQRKYSNIPI